jgi:AraC-like DNA-binding protein
VPSEVRSTFFGRMVASDLGHNRLYYVHSTAQHITRGGARVYHECDDPFLLKYLIEGQGSAIQNGNSHDLAAGDLFLQDTRSGSEVRTAGEFKALTLSLSRKLVERHFFRPEYLCAVPLSAADSPAGRIAADLLESIARNCGHTDADGMEALVDGLLQILAVAFGHSPRLCPPVTLSHSALLIRIRNYIHAHLEEEQLSPSRIAAAHGISERYLNKLFETEATTVSRWIWEQRLQASQRSLARSEFSGRKISEIAYSCGFNNMSHFSFSFRKRFGCTPRQYRRHEMLAHANHAGSSRRR